MDEVSNLIDFIFFGEFHTSLNCEDISAKINVFKRKEKDVRSLLVCCPSSRNLALFALNFQMQVTAEPRHRQL